MGKKPEEHQTGLKDHKRQDMVEAVLQLLRKQAPLTLKQEKFCNRGCVEMFLRAKGENVKKAAKHLRACLSWRDTIGADNVMADEFSAELAEGVTYVAGHDEESRPVLIFRFKQDYQKFHSERLFTRLLVFTFEVAISTMPKNVDQFVLLFDASFFRSASSFMNLFLAALKIVAEYYPGRLFKAFVIDPPSFFSYLWKGVRPFVELSTVTTVVSSLEYEDSFDFNDVVSHPRASSLRFNPKSTAKIGACSSSRFAFQVSTTNFDSLKPWYLTFADTSSFKVGPTTPLGPAFISPLNARSFSFASPAARTPRGMFASTPLPRRVAGPPRTPRPSFLQSPAMFFRRECHVRRAEKSREAFVPFLKFYRLPYDEMVYRSKMRAPLGGLISIVSPQLRRRHVSVSQRF